MYIHIFEIHIIKCLCKNVELHCELINVTCIAYAFFRDLAQVLCTDGFFLLHKKIIETSVYAFRIDVEVYRAEAFLSSGQCNCKKMLFILDCSIEPANECFALQKSGANFISDKRHSDKTLPADIFNAGYLVDRSQEKRKGPLATQ